MACNRGQYNDSMSHAEGLYSVEQVRAFDAHAISAQGIAGITLMTRAGEASLRVLRERWPEVRRIAIVCGGGNNGGDGYVLGERARAGGIDATVLALVDPKALHGDARRAADRYLAAGGRLQPFAPAALAGAELLVDALLGTGLREPPRADFAAAIECHQRGGIADTGARPSLGAGCRYRSRARRGRACHGHGHVRRAQARPLPCRWPGLLRPHLLR